MASPPNRHVSNCRSEKFKVDRVIEIVTVISDLVRQVRDLRFERRAFVSVLARHWRIVKLVVLPQSLAHFKSQVQS